MFQLWSERLLDTKHTVYAVQDRSGFIDKTEIYNLLGTVFGDVPDQRMVTALIAHFDSNKDGKVAPPSLLLPFFRLSFTLPIAPKLTPHIYPQLRSYFVLLLCRSVCLS